MREAAQCEAELRRRGRFEGRKCNSGNGAAEKAAITRQRHALDLSRGRRSTTRRRGADATLGKETMPSPRTSICPAIVAGALIVISSPSRRSSVWSSATRRAPWSIKRSAKSDLPAPDGPRSRIPSLPSAIAVPWTRIMRRSRCSRLTSKSINLAVQLCANVTVQQYLGVLRLLNYNM